MTTRIYIVQPGDYLKKIAREQFGDETRWAEIAYMNSLEQPYTIFANQVLTLTDDSAEPVNIVVTAPKPERTAAPVKQAGFKLTPATIGIAVAIAAVFIFWDDIK